MKPEEKLEFVAVVDAVVNLLLAVVRHALRDSIHSRGELNAAKEAFVAKVEDLEERR